MQLSQVPHQVSHQLGLVSFQPNIPSEQVKVLVGIMVFYLFALPYRSSPRFPNKQGLTF
jgi:hypothetical protein